MKLLLDKCVPFPTYAAILERGHDVDWVRHWPTDPGDRMILKVAYEQQRVIVTLERTSANSRYQRA